MSSQNVFSAPFRFVVLAAGIAILGTMSYFAVLAPKANIPADGDLIKYLIAALLVVITIYSWIIAIYSENGKKKQIVSEQNESLKKLFSIIAHDLRSPLNSIVELDKMLVECIACEQYDQAREIASMILNSSSEAKVLLNSLLDWSLINAGRLSIKKEEVDLYDIMKNNIVLFNSMAALKKITISENIQSGSLTIFDRHMLETIIRNVVFNSIKFCPQAGYISITFSEEKNYSVVTICDNGTGIDARTLDRLNNFINSHKCTTKEGESHGLGLSICKDFIRANKAKIIFRNGINAGTCVDLKLPKPTTQKVSDRKKSYQVQVSACQM